MSTRPKCYQLDEKQCNETTDCYWNGSYCSLRDSGLPDDVPPGMQELILQYSGGLPDDLYHELTKTYALFQFIYPNLRYNPNVRIWDNATDLGDALVHICNNFDVLQVSVENFITLFKRWIELKGHLSDINVLNKHILRARNFLSTFSVDEMINFLYVIVMFADVRHLVRYHDVVHFVLNTALNYDAYVTHPSILGIFLENYLNSEFVNRPFLEYLASMIENLIEFNAGSVDELYADNQVVISEIDRLTKQLATAEAWQRAELQDNIMEMRQQLNDIQESSQLSRQVLDILQPFYDMIITKLDDR